METIRVSKTGRDKLLKLKRITSIPTWNVLCRWAFCVSVAERSSPRDERIPADSPLELDWRTFAGDQEATYLALLKERCRRDGIDHSPASLWKQFRLHLHRGIGYLAGDPNLRGIADLIALAARAPKSE